MRFTGIRRDADPAKYCTQERLHWIRKRSEAGGGFRATQVALGARVLVLAWQEDGGGVCV